MGILNNLFVILVLHWNYSFLKVNGQNCTLVQIVFNNGKEINADQLAIDQVVYESGIFTTPDDPMSPLFGEDPSDQIYTEQMNVSRYLLNTVRLWHEIQPSSSADLLSCISRADRCPKRPAYTCSRERSFDGTCNNVKNPSWGAIYTTYGRILPASFEDDINTFRRCSRTKAELPSARIVGNKINDAEKLQEESQINTHGSFNEFEQPSSRKSYRQSKLDKKFKRNSKKRSCRHSLKFVNEKYNYAEPIARPWKKQPRDYTFSFNGYMFGQIVSHDIGDRKLTKNQDRLAPGYQCCRKANSIGMAQEISNRACAPIVVPANDPFYSQYNTTCLNYVRSSSTVPASCKMGNAEFVTSATSYADLSIIYGTTIESSNSIRSFRNGQMLTNKNNVLPEVENCTGPACFRLGDFRINQTPALALLHSIWLRNHNRLCKLLAKQNPGWNDQRLFEECRRLNIAIYQHILYQEWLPLLLKKRYSNKFGIKCDSSESDCGQYQSNIDTSALSDFMQGSYRTLHVCIPDCVFVLAESGKIIQTYAFSDVVGVTNMLNYQFNGMLRGMLRQRIPCDNLGYSDEIRNKIFKIKNGMGADLFSVDVNRGRDHGVPPYYKYYTESTGKVVNEWNDLDDDFTYEHLDLLSEIYDNVRDVDMVTGCLLERRDSSLLGVVARYVMAKQFHRLKYGDRYFYSFADNPHAFTGAQINEIEEMSFAKVLCQNTGLKSVPQHAFLVESRHNPNILCRNYKDFDLSLWK